MNYKIFKLSILIIIILICLVGCYKPLVKIDAIQTQVTPITEPTPVVINIEVESKPMVKMLSDKINLNNTIDNISKLIPKKYTIDENKRYCGVYVENPEEFNKFNNSVNVMAWFENFELPSYNKLELCLDKHEYIAFITLQPDGWYLSKLNKGYYDNEIINYLKLLSKGDRIHTELFVRFAHEMEMRPAYGDHGWYIWQTYDYKAYIAAWKRVVTLGKKYAPNVKWVWSPNRADSTNTIKYYPGDEYVDYVSLSLNDSRERESFKKFYENEGKREYLEAYNKPIIFGEVAKYTKNINKRNQYINEMFEYLSNYDKCIGVIFLDKNINGTRLYQFSDNDNLLEVFNSNARKYIYEKTYNKISDIDKSFYNIGYFRIYNAWFIFRNILLGY